MRLHQISMTNFKQYYGKQSIEFAGSDEKDFENVTVIFGENGRGKTTLYRSILFGFYGDLSLEQDDYENNKNSTIYLANTKALEEASRENKGIEVKVNISFFHEHEYYELERYFQAIKDKNGFIYEDSPSVKLTIIKKNGNANNLNENEEEDIKEIINNILDERVKNYFLFDGERIESLTKASKKQRENIQLGIKNLLKIDDLFLLKEAFEENKKTVTKDLKKISTGDMLKNIKDRENIAMRIDEAKENKQQLQEEIATASKEKEDVDATLKDLDSQKPTLDKIIETEERLEKLNSALDDYQEELVNITPTISVLLAKDLIGELIVDLEDNKIKEDIPEDLKNALIETLLNEFICICGREIKIDSKEYENLIEWKKSSEGQTTERNVMKFFGDLRSTIEHIRHHENTISILLKNVSDLEEQIDINTYELERYKKQVEEVPEDKQKLDIQYRDKLSEKIGKLKEESKFIEERITELNDEEKRLIKKYKSLSVEDELQKQLKEKEKLIEKSSQALIAIINNFIVEVKNELEERANNIFKNLIDISGSKNLKKIVVNDDYTLDVLDWNGRPFLANISAGQRQIISLSFITALAEVAGGESMLEIPLFMDTPFGRLSPEHRYNLVKYIPEITPQWILLVTGSEFRKEEEAKFLKQTGKWDKFYVLESKSEAETKIKEMLAEEFFALKTEV
ncbi:AAA family ATPase [Marinococcus halophilus]|uniref:AAA family ATPase n=1 Tax=Marinococcus halophilus TaxID=1371 RepID=UPI0009A6A47B|nr:AAA family ATPase [Marinococcus halophilus]